VCAWPGAIMNIFSDAFLYFLCVTLIPNRERRAQFVLQFGSLSAKRATVAFGDSGQFVPVENAMRFNAGDLPGFVHRVSAANINEGSREIN
jgi:hypothetical protein